MLVNAGVRFGGGPMRTMGGAQAGSVERARWGETGALRNIHAGEATVVGGASISDRNGRPSGYLHPRSWSMPIKGGGMASRFQIAGTGTLSPTGQAGYPMTVALGTALTLDATASLIASAAAAISSAASLAALASGGAAAEAVLTAAVALSAAIGAIASKSAAMTGTGSVAAGMTALGSMEVDITQTAEAINPDTIAAAVWAHGSAVSLVAAVELIRQISDNRLEVDITGQRLVLYDDDGVTELRTWALDTDAGEDVATATGVQTKRGAGA